MIIHHPKLLEKWGIAEMNSHLTGDFLGWVGILIPNLTFNWDTTSTPLLAWSYLAFYVTILINQSFIYWYRRYPTEINKNSDLTSPNQLTIKSSFCSSHSVYIHPSHGHWRTSLARYTQPLIAAWWRMRPRWVKHVMQTKRRLFGQILNIVWRCMSPQIQATKMSYVDEYWWCAYTSSISK